MPPLRSLKASICLGLALAFTGFQFYTSGFGTLPAMTQRATMLGFASILAFILNPALRWDDRTDLKPHVRAAAICFDLLLIGLSLYCCSYVLVNGNALADRSGAETPTDLLVAALGPLVVLEMVRRVVGTSLFLVTIFVIAYAYLGDVMIVVAGSLIALALIWSFAGRGAATAIAFLLVFSIILPGVREFLDPSSFYFDGERHTRMAAYLWLTPSGTFGSISGIMTEFIFIFILFAALLEATGAGQILINLAFALTGRFRGGPAQSAVVASSLFGMVSGSTMANVVSTGTFTIPLMIRTGFSRLFAGAVETIASCGGQIVPPIMGASIFIMAEVIGVPYSSLMIHALIPAFLFFLTLSATIYFEANRINLDRVDPSEIPNGWIELRKGGFLLIPVVILIASIVSGETPGRAGFKAVVSLIVMVDLVRSHRWAWGSAGRLGLSMLVCAEIALLWLAFGPLGETDLFKGTIVLPMIGEVGIFRATLVGAAIVIALVPALRGLPASLLIALALMKWQLPRELSWVGDLPFIGIGLPLALFGVAITALIAPVFTDHEHTSARTSAATFSRQLVEGANTGARNAISLVGATTAIGLIVGLLVLAAAGVRISIFVTEASSSSMLLAFFMVMIASLVLGMGLPTIAAYLLLVIVVAPALEDLGANLIAAHLFIFYFGVLSSITPPVALAAFVASGISQASALHTAFTACRLSAAAFLVPYLFVFYPELLFLEGTWQDVVYRLIITSIAVIYLAMIVIGFGVRKIRLLESMVLVMAVVLMVVPPVWMNIVGVAVGAALVWLQLRGAPRNPVNV